MTPKKKKTLALSDSRILNSAQYRYAAVDCDIAADDELLRPLYYCRRRYGLTGAIQFGFGAEAGTSTHFAFLTININSSCFFKIKHQRTLLLTTCCCCCCCFCRWETSSADDSIGGADGARAAASAAAATAASFATILFITSVFFRSKWSKNCGRYFGLSGFVSCSVAWKEIL